MTNFIENNRTITKPRHCNGVIMSATASQITSLTIAYSTVCSGADKRKHQSSASLAFVRGIYRWPVNSPHKGPVMRKMLPFDDIIMGKRYRLMIIRATSYLCMLAWVTGEAQRWWALRISPILGDVTKVKIHHILQMLIEVLMLAQLPERLNEGFTLSQIANNFPTN